MKNITMLSTFHRLELFRSLHFVKCLPEVYLEKFRMN